MNLEAVRDAVADLVAQHKAAFTTLGRRETQALEIGALVLAVEHYRRVGFETRAVNLQQDAFKVKLSAKGYPSNFSWYEVSRGTQRYEIHANLPVRGATNHDKGVYVVDVGVAVAGAVPAVKKGRVAVANDNLVSFVEAKKLVIYPMLLAQFVGIVHEIKPKYLGGRAAVGRAHFYPALVSVGYLRGTSEDIVKGYKRRGYLVNVVPTFDERVVSMAHDPLAPSPFRPRARHGRPARPKLEVVSDDVPF